MEDVVVCLEAQPRTARSEGCGQGVRYGGEVFCYRVGKNIPKDRVVHLTCETNYMGRVHGEKQYLIVAWNHTAFVVLAHIYYEGVKKHMARFKGLTNQQAIELIQKDEDDQKARIAALPKCAVCGNPVNIVLYDGQGNDECSDCYRGRTGEK